MLWVMMLSTRVTGRCKAVDLWLSAQGALPYEMSSSWATLSASCCRQAQGFKKVDAVTMLQHSRQAGPSVCANTPLASAGPLHPVGPPVLGDWNQLQ